MKTNKISGVVLPSAVLLAVTLNLSAGEMKPAKAASPEFERLKTLIGTWTGKTDMGQGPVELNITYQLIAGGSVLEERVFAGTPQEMTTMYYDKGGRITATHYCILGNQPQFLFKSSDDKSISFNFDATCGIDTAKESHMHGLKIVFNDADTITTSCQAFMDGKEVPEHETVLKRAKK